MRNTAVIAVVDDDESVREAVVGLMKSYGYDAVAYGGAEEFLYSDRPSGVACLISDVQMPGMTGPELHSRLVASGQHIPTILITAYPDQAMRTRTLKAGVMGYLAKPFREEDLLACIRSALASAAPDVERRHQDDA